MTLEFRPEIFGHNGKARRCTGVYLDQRRVGEVADLGSLAVFRSGGTQRSFSSQSEARRWLSDTYRAAQQSAPRVRQQPARSVELKTQAPAQSPAQSPAPVPTRRFPTDPERVEREIFDLMLRTGRARVTPEDRGLPDLTLDDVLKAGLDALLGSNPANGYGVLQAKRLMVNETIRHLGHFLPAQFDFPEKRNQLLNPSVIVMKEKAEIPAVAQALVEALERKQQQAGKGDEREDPRTLRDQIADMFEDFEDGLEDGGDAKPESPESVPESRPRLPPGTPKFTEDEVRKIRADSWHGSNSEELAEKYHTSVTTIDRIMDGSYVPRRSPE